MGEEELFVVSSARTAQDNMWELIVIGETILRRGIGQDKGRLAVVKGRSQQHHHQRQQQRRVSGDERVNRRRLSRENDTE